MDVPWGDRRCILCLQDAPSTLEHVLPKALGGKLTCRFLCKTCNDRLGRLVEAEAKLDPLIRQAAARLEPIAPTVVQNVLEGAAYLGSTSVGEVDLVRLEGVVRTRHQQQTDGTINLDTRHAPRAIRQLLSRRGAPQAHITDAVERFERAADEEIVELGYGREAVKRTIQSVRPIFDGQILSDRTALKIAYEFLALHLGTMIYDKCLDRLRAGIRDGIGPEEARFDVEQLVADEQDPIHGLVLEQNNPHARVQIRIFGLAAFRVHFLGLRVNARRAAYTLNLESGDEHFTDALV